MTCERENLFLNYSLVNTKSAQGPAVDSTIFVWRATALTRVVSPDLVHKRHHSGHVIGYWA